MQRMIAKQIFNFVYRVKDIQNTNVSANDLWLKAMFLVTSLTFIEKFPKIILLENDFH